MASVATCRAESKPKVRSVASRSLSIVLGTPTMGTPMSISCAADAHAPVAPDADDGVHLQLSQALHHLAGAVDQDAPFAGHGEGVAAVAGAQDGAPHGEHAAHRLRGEGAYPRPAPTEEPIEPGLDPYTSQP